MKKKIEEKELKVPGRIQVAFNQQAEMPDAQLAHDIIKSKGGHFSKYIADVVDHYLMHGYQSEPTSLEILERIKHIYRINTEQDFQNFIHNDKILQHAKKYALEEKEPKIMTLKFNVNDPIKNKAWMTLRNIPGNKRVTFLTQAVLSYVNADKDLLTTNRLNRKHALDIIYACRQNPETMTRLQKLIQEVN